MPLLNQFRTYAAFNRDMKLLVAEAYLLLGWARILKWLPFSRIAPGLGNFMEETDLERNETNERQFRKISEAIHLASRHTFWESQCMVKALAGMIMLKRRGLESTIYFGTGRDDNGQLAAHAWLRSGSIYLSGAEEMHRFTVVAKYAKKINEG